jgi:hypothetical protein
MISKSIAAALIVSSGYWHGPEPVRKYTLQNDGTVAEDVANPSVARYYFFRWPHFEQKIPLPGYWKPDFPLPRPIISRRVKNKYGEVYFEEPEEYVPEPLPAVQHNDRAIGNVDRFGTVLH